MGFSQTRHSPVQMLPKTARHQSLVKMIFKITQNLTPELISLEEKDSLYPEEKEYNECVGSVVRAVAK